MNDKDRLEAYDRMYAEVKKQYDMNSQKIQIMKDQGKSKTVSFKEAMGMKGFYLHMLIIYESFGIHDTDTYLDSNKADHVQ